MSFSYVVEIDLSEVAPFGGQPGTDCDDYDRERKLLWSSLEPIQPGSQVRIRIGDRRWPPPDSVALLVKHERRGLSIQLAGTLEALRAWDQARRIEAGSD